ncbi:hypothetical protein YC2023_090191 [Brassica napus]
MSGDKKEAFRCIKGLKVPFFHHEIVKRALIMAMERQKAQVKLLDLLKEAVQVGLINTTQVTKGFSRIIGSVEDLSLDIPEARSVLQSFFEKNLTLLGRRRNRDKVARVHCERSEGEDSGSS